MTFCRHSRRKVIDFLAILTPVFENVSFSCRIFWCIYLVTIISFDWLNRCSSACLELKCVFHLQPLCLIGKVFIRYRHFNVFVPAKELVSGSCRRFRHCDIRTIASGHDNLTVVLALFCSECSGICVKCDCMYLSLIVVLHCRLSVSGNGNFLCLWFLEAFIFHDFWCHFAIHSRPCMTAFFQRITVTLYILLIMFYYIVDDVCFPFCIECQILIRHIRFVLFRTFCICIPACKCITGSCRLRYGHFISCFYRLICLTIVVLKRQRMHISCVTVNNRCSSITFDCHLLFLRCCKSIKVLYFRCDNRIRIGIEVLLCSQRISVIIGILQTMLDCVVYTLHIPFCIKCDVTCRNHSVKCFFKLCVCIPACKYITGTIWFFLPFLTICKFFCLAVITVIVMDRYLMAVTRIFVIYIRNLSIVYHIIANRLWCCKSFIRFYCQRQMFSCFSCDIFCLCQIILL